MGCEAGRYDEISPIKGIFFMKQSLKGWLTKAKEAPSPHEVRLTPLETNPVFQFFGNKQIFEKFALFIMCNIFLLSLIIL